MGYSIDFRIFVAENLTIMNMINTKEEAIKAAKTMISEKREVVKWIRSNEPYENLTKKGIILGRIGK